MHEMTYGDFLAERLIDTLESASAEGVSPEFIDDNDTMLSTSWGKGIDWGFVYVHNMVSRAGREPEPEPPRCVRRLSSLRLQRLLGSGGERSERPLPRRA